LVKVASILKDFLWILTWKLAKVEFYQISFDKIYANTDIWALSKISAIASSLRSHKGLRMGNNISSQVYIEALKPACKVKTDGRS